MLSEVVGSHVMVNLSCHERLTTKFNEKLGMLPHFLFALYVKGSSSKGISFTIP